jgi:TonB family protein
VHAHGPRQPSSQVIEVVRPHEQTHVSYRTLLLAPLCACFSTLAQQAAPIAAPPAQAASVAPDVVRHNARVVAESPLGTCFTRPPAYPTVALRSAQSGLSLVVFTVSESGSIESPALLRSSGHAVLDRAALGHLVKCIAEVPLDSQPKLPVGRYALPLLWRIE